MNAVFGNVSNPTVQAGPLAGPSNVDDSFWGCVDRGTWINSDLLPRQAEKDCKGWNCLRPGDGRRVWLWCNYLYGHNFGRHRLVEFERHYVTTLSPYEFDLLDQFRLDRSRPVIRPLICHKPRLLRGGEIPGTVQVHHMDCGADAAWIGSTFDIRPKRVQALQRMRPLTKRRRELLDQFCTDPYGCLAEMQPVEAIFEDGRCVSLSTLQCTFDGLRILPTPSESIRLMGRLEK
jgi:hypothetical protein